MTRFKPDLLLAASLLPICMLLICIAVSCWQDPGSRLSAAEVETQTARFEQLAPMPAAEKAAALP